MQEAVHAAGLEKDYYYQCVMPHGQVDARDHRPHEDASGHPGNIAGGGIETGNLVIRIKIECVARMRWKGIGRRDNRAIESIMHHHDLLNKICQPRAWLVVPREHDSSFAKLRLFWS